MSTDQAIRDAAAMAQAGRIAEAVAALTAAAWSDPGHPGVHALLGTLYHATGRPADALTEMRRAHELAPDEPRIAYQLGVFLSQSGDAAGGLAMMSRAAELDPAWVTASLGVASACNAAGHFARAEEVYRRALAQNPDQPELLCGLGGLFITTGRPSQAVALFRRAAQAHPTNADVLGKLLSALNYADDATREETLDAHIRWGRAVSAAVRPATAWPNPRHPERRLRLGFLSPDLYDHSCAYFLRPILQHRDAAAFEVFCYSTITRSDWMTAELQRLSDHWRTVADFPEPKLLETLRADRLDVLVELSGHTAMGPLAALRHRVAPIQATYLGYPNTTGLPAIDSRIVDSTTDPADADRFATERLIRLDPCFLCYSPAEFAPPPAPPAPAAAPVTFASFNSIRKLSPTTIRMWSRVLAAVPGSRLLLKTRGLFSPYTQSALLEEFAAHGISADRVTCSEMVPDKSAHLGWYHRADIALDTFPYNGTTTTCEALWMGVPVVSLAGDRHASRVGLSLLSAAGLPELVARTEDEFVAIAAALAADPARRADLRANLRPRLLSSPLMDAPAHSTRFFAALRSAWRTLCHTH